MLFFALSLVILSCAVQALPFMRYISEKEIVAADGNNFSKLEKPYRQMIENGKTHNYLKKAKQTVCPVSVGNFTLISDPIPAVDAEAACAAIGKQLANVNDLNIIQVNGLLGSCAFLSAQINSYNGFAAQVGQCQYYNLGGVVDIVSGLAGCNQLYGQVLCQDIGLFTETSLTTSTEYVYTNTATVQTTTTTTFISGSVSVNIVSIDVTIPTTETVTEVFTETVLTSITVIDPVTETMIVSTGTEIYTTTLLSSTTTTLISTMTSTKTRFVKPTICPCNDASCHHRRHQHHQHHRKPCIGKDCANAESLPKNASNAEKSVKQGCPFQGCDCDSSSSSASSSSGSHQPPVCPNNMCSSDSLSCATEFLRVCPCAPEPRTGMVIVRNFFGFEEAKCACTEMGMELADVTSDNFRTVSQLAFDCAGSVESAWIGSWNGDKYNGACLAFHTGAAAGAGAITTGDCKYGRPVICQKSQKHAPKPVYKGACQNPQPQKLIAQQTCTYSQGGIAAVTSLGVYVQAPGACSLLGSNYVPADISNNNVDNAFAVMNACGIFEGAFVHSYNQQGSNACIFLQALAGGLNVVHFANTLLGGILDCTSSMAFLCQSVPQIVTLPSGSVAASTVTDFTDSTVTQFITDILTTSSISTIVTSTTTTTTLVIPAVRTVTETSSSIVQITEETVTSDFTIYTSTSTENVTSTSTITQAIFSTSTSTRTIIIPTTVCTTITLLQ